MKQIEIGDKVTVEFTVDEITNNFYKSSDALNGIYLGRSLKDSTRVLNVEAPPRPPQIGDRVRPIGRVHGDTWIIDGEYKDRWVFLSYGGKPFISILQKDQYAKV